MQPVTSVAVITVVPADKPVTAPVLLMVATAGLLLLQEILPNGKEEVSETIPPGQLTEGPEIGVGVGLTVMAKLLMQPAAT